MVRPPSVYLLLRIALAILGFFACFFFVLVCVNVCVCVFPYETEDSPFKICEELFWNFDGDSNQSVDCFCKMTVFFFKTGFPCVTVLAVLELALVNQPGLELTEIRLSLPPRSWDYRWYYHHPAEMAIVTLLVLLIHDMGDLFIFWYILQVISSMASIFLSYKSFTCLVSYLISFYCCEETP